MEFFSFISFAALGYILYKIHQKPKKWIEQIQYMPIIGFMLYARFAEHEAWINAFSFGGLLALITVLVLFHERFLMDRLFFGVNLFLVLGAAGFLFDIDQIIHWYGATKGGPFFGCIVFVGLLSTLFTRTGFIGKRGMSKDATRYASFLLLAASVICLIWSIQTDESGILYSVAGPFFLLKFFSEKLKQHVA